MCPEIISIHSKEDMNSDRFWAIWSLLCLYLELFQGLRTYVYTPIIDDRARVQSTVDALPLSHPLSHRAGQANSYLKLSSTGKTLALV